MKNKIFSLLLCTVMALLTLSSCQALFPKNVVGASLNENGELILTFSDNTTQNLGVVKGADGNDGNDGKDGIDGSDGKDFSPCSHIYQDWQTVLSPSCTSIGYNTRSCSLCGDLDYQFTQALGHTYENPTYVIDIPCQPSWINKTCTSCGDSILIEEPASEEHSYSDWEIVEEYACGTTKQQRTCLSCGEIQTQTINGEHTFGDWEIVEEYACGTRTQRICNICETVEMNTITTEEQFLTHTFDENTLCTTCGHQEFIQSEEYIEEVTVLATGYGSSYPTTGTLWWNKDRTYGLKILYFNARSHARIKGFEGTPVHIQIPAYYDNIPIIYIEQPDAFSSLGAFQNCTTLKSIYIPDTVTRINAYAFDGCTALESVRFSENLTSIGGTAFRNCTSLKTLDFKNNNSGGLDFWHSFNNCTSLKEIYFPLQARTYNDSTSFENCALEKIYISEQYRSYYKETFYTSYPNLQIISYN